LPARPREAKNAVNEILGRLRRFGHPGQGLLMIDNELAATAAHMAKATLAATPAAA
jgi:hypothetical protein